LVENKENDVRRKIKKKYMYMYEYKNTNNQIQQAIEKVYWIYKYIKGKTS
jgi:hypothetical protein